MLMLLPLDGLAKVDTALLWLNPTLSQAELGATSEIVIQLDDITNVYAVELELNFDTNILAVVDADPGEPGVQITSGVCPAPDFVVLKTADNSAGKIDYAVTQLNPTLPCDGGQVATVEFQCIGAGAGEVSIISQIVADPDGNAIDVVFQYATLTCTNPHTLYLPVLLNNSIFE